MGTHPIFESDFDCLTEMTFHLIKIGPKNSLIQSAIRYSSKTSLQVQREQWRASQLTRVEKVEKQLQQRRVQVRGPDERTSFIRHKLFGQYEQGRFPFYHYAQTHSPRLEWFERFPKNKTSGKLLEMKREEILSACKDGSIYQLANGMARNPNVPIHQNTLNLLDSLETMVINGYTEEALSLANHFACTDVLENYYKHLENLQSDAFIVPAVHESFADSQALLFNTKIEEFGDNVVVNGSKAYVYGADKATHFITFVSTRVKERNGKIYKRLSSVLIPADADGVEIIDQSEVNVNNDDLASRIGLYQIVFEDVEIEPSWVVGNMGYGKEYITHLQDCQKLYTSKISCSILERNHEEFKAIVSQTPKSNNDLVRRLVAKGHLEKISLDTMVGQAADRRGYLYTEIRAELNAAKVVANGVREFLCQMEQFEDSINYDFDKDILNYMQNICDGNMVLLSSIGYSGFNALFGLNWGTLERRVGSLFFTPGNTFSMGYWLRRAITKFFYIRNPKIYEWTLGFIYGENKIFRSGNLPGTAPSFNEQFEFNGQMFAERALELFEWHGDDINSDEHVVAEVANVAVQYYKLGCLWSYLNHYDLIDRNYDNILIKKIF